MRVALGLKAHSGWAALVALGGDSRAPALALRERLELAPEDGKEWAKQPYHAAEGRGPEDARAVVKRGIASAHELAERELQRVMERCRGDGHEVCACAVLTGGGMPAWSVDEILAVHFRMHQAEGELFRGALARAAEGCDLALVAIPEKRVREESERSLGLTHARLDATLAALGKSAGPPWGKDQKDAALAALIALTTAPHVTPPRARAAQRAN